MLWLNLQRDQMLTFLTCSCRISWLDNRTSLSVPIKVDSVYTININNLKWLVFKKQCSSYLILNDLTWGCAFVQDLIALLVAVIQAREFSMLTNCLLTTHFVPPPPGDLSDEAHVQTHSSGAPGDSAFAAPERVSQHPHPHLAHLNPVSPPRISLFWCRVCSLTSSFHGFLGICSKTF